MQAHATGLELVYLPTYSPHLNPIERLWRYMLGQLTHNYFFADLSAVAPATVDWLNNVSFAQFCTLKGLDEQQLVFL